MSGMEPVAAAALVPEIGALLAPVAAAAAPVATAVAPAATGLLGSAAAAAAPGLAAEGAGMLAATAPEALGAMSYVTPSVLGEAALPTSELLGGMYTGATAGPAPAWQTALGQAGKAGKAYSAVNAGMGAGQPQQMPPPQARPVFEGQAAPIAQQQPERNSHQFAQMLLEQRKRGMLG